MAYVGILNGTYVSNPLVKLQVARHVAYFAGIDKSKRGWDDQWDVTARPFIYNNGLLAAGTKNYDLIRNPVMRSLLFDRRMFVHDTELYVPRLLASADSVIAAIDLAAKR